MKRRPTALQAVISPKLVVGRLVLVASVFVTAAIWWSARQEGPFAERAQETLMDTVSPVFAVLRTPHDAALSVWEKTGSFFSTYQENQRLRDENESLKRWHRIALQLDAENDSLRQLMHASSALANHTVTARVVAESRSPFAVSGLINAGDGAGIRRGLPVVNEFGVVGRVTDVGDRSARVLFLHDTRSNIPVYAEGSGARAIVSGMGGELAQLRYVQADLRLEKGERLYTSGDGGLFPRGLPVGVVAETNGSGEILVQPFASRHRVDYVSVLEQPAIAAPAQAETPSAPPPTGALK